MITPQSGISNPIGATDVLTGDSPRGEILLGIKTS